jgi:hypothetical protein
MMIMTGTSSNESVHGSGVFASEKGILGNLDYYVLPVRGQRKMSFNVYTDWDAERLSLSHFAPMIVPRFSHVIQNTVSRAVF